MNSNMFIPTGRLFKALIAACFVTMLVACSDSEIESEAELRTVRAVEVSDVNNSRVSTYSGVSKSARESRLSFKVAGTVQDIPVNVGDQISAGSTIAQLDSSTYDLQLQQAQATLAQSEAAARNASTVYERTRSLYASNNASLGDLDAARAAAEQAQAQRRAASKSLELARLNLSYTKLSVDVDCLVDAILVEVNENVSTATEVARVNCSNELEVEVTVPEGVVTELSQGEPVTIKFDAASNKVFSGKILEIGIGVTGVGSTFPVTVSIDSDDPVLRPGLAASVSFALKGGMSEIDDIVVPVSALVKRTDGTYVFVVQSDSDNPKVGTVTLRKVEVGQLTSQGVIVKDGLRPHDTVVSAGVSFLRDGLQVAL